MFYKLLQDTTDRPSEQKAGHFLLRQVDRYTKDLRQKLDDQIDKRLVRTFFDVFATMLLFRNRSMGLLLSELGGYICGFDHAPAGTKRISNLLRSKKWKADLIDDFLFSRSQDRVKKMLQEQKRPLLIWDDSRIEKPESWFAEGLCSVWSSKGKRLTKIKRGFYRPPSSRICVPGYKWTGVILSCLGGTPSVCQMTWWTTRGKYKEDPDNIAFRLLRKIKHHFLEPLVHVLDRGYANQRMLGYLLHFKQDFIIRWKKNHLLEHTEKGLKQTHLLARSFKAKASKIVKDKDRKKLKRISIAWAAVTHPEYPDNQMFLIIVRDKNNYNGPMYILTSLPIQGSAQAWEVLFSYMHRWEIEQSFRFAKSELAMESPRLWFWDNRMKLMGIVTLVYDFILRLMRNWKSWTAPFMRQWCHRTGERYRNASIPLYRLRMAISICLTVFWAKAQNSG